MTNVTTFIGDVLYFIKNDLSSSITDPNSQDRTIPDAQWTCNDNASNTTVDDFFNRNNGTASTNTSNLSVSGKINTALQFNITNSERATINHSSSIDSNIMSLAFWVKTNTNSVQTPIIGKYDNPNTQGFILINDNTQLWLLLDNENYVNIGSMSENTWHHMVFTINSDSKETRIYVDNILQYSDDGSLYYTANTSPMYFAYGTNFSNYGNCELEDVRFYNGIVIPSEERTRIYNGGTGTLSLNSSKFVMTSYPQREVKYPLITVKMTNQEANRAGMQTTAMDVLVTLEVRIWARNQKEKDTLATAVYDRLRSIQFTSSGSINNDLHSFNLNSMNEVDEDGARGIKSRILEVQYKFFNIN